MTAKIPKRLHAALFLFIGALLPLDAATVNPVDPVAGGIGYEWAVKMGETDQVSLEGSVGAWSWDDGGAATPSGVGWTHTSDWIALELESDCRLTIRLKRRDLGTDGSNNLFPAISIYRGWEVAGTESHTFANRGDISWALDLTYLTHVEETPGDHVIEARLLLKAGKYSINLGGNSPGLLSEPNQGFTATLTTKGSHDDPAVAVTDYRLIQTTRPSFVLKGGLKNPASLAALLVRKGGRTLRGTVVGGSWAARINGLKPGRNLVTVVAKSIDGTSSKPIQLVIVRTVTAPKRQPTQKPKSSASPRGGVTVGR